MTNARVRTTHYIHECNIQLFNTTIVKFIPVARQKGKNAAFLFRNFTLVSSAAHCLCPSRRQGINLYLQNQGVPFYISKFEMSSFSK